MLLNNMYRICITCDIQSCSPMRQPCLKTFGYSTWLGMQAVQH